MIDIFSTGVGMFLLSAFVVLGSAWGLSFIMWDWHTHDRKYYSFLRRIIIVSTIVLTGVYYATNG